MMARANVYTHAHTQTTNIHREQAREGEGGREGGEREGERVR